MTLSTWQLQRLDQTLTCLSASLANVELVETLRASQRYFREHIYPRLRSLPSAHIKRRPRLQSLMEGYLAECEYLPDIQSLADFVRSRAPRLSHAELELVLPMAQLVALLLAAERQESALALQKCMHAYAALREIDADQLRSDVCDFEELMLEDPSGHYSRLDNESQAVYREELRRIAKKFSISELKVAEVVLTLAKQSTEAPRQHLGYYLVDAGRRTLCKILRARTDAFQSRIESTPQALTPRVARYASTLSLFSLILAVIFFIMGAPASNAASIAFFIGSWLVFYQWYFPFAERTFGVLIGVRRLPITQFSTTGIPDHHFTAIVVPTLVLSADQLMRVAVTLERNFVVANDTNVVSVLLTDFVDSEQQQPSEEELRLIDLVKGRISDLNRKYGRSFGGAPFLLLHRDRKYSEVERAWIGWERKLGKLRDLNRFILTGECPFSIVEGDAGRVSRIKNIVVLDDDCRLTRDALQILVGAIDTPIAAPRFSPAGDLVHGYAMLAPCAVTSSDAEKNWSLGMLMVGQTLNDAAQFTNMRCPEFDYFGQVHYPGKGLYVVEAFEKCLAGKLPSQCVLSHDTLESVFARTGFVGRAALTEEFPSDYWSLMRRQERWSRGDWQNLFLVLLDARFKRNLKATPGASLALLRITYQVLSAVAPAIQLALILLLFGGSPDNRLVCGMVFYAFLALPIYIRAGFIFCEGAMKGFESTDFLRPLYSTNSILLIRFALLPTDAGIAIASLARAIVRMLRRRRLQEWKSSATANSDREIRTRFVYMLMAPMVIALYFVAVHGLHAAVVGALLVWIATPVVIFRRHIAEPRS